jgi:hypothetical protein
MGTAAKGNKHIELLHIVKASGQHISSQRAPVEALAAAAAVGSRPSFVVVAA